MCRFVPYAVFTPPSCDSYIFCHYNNSAFPRKSAVWCLLPFCAFYGFVLRPFRAFCRFVHLPFCVSAVLCVCRLVRLPFCASAVLCVCRFVCLPFCASAVLCVCRFVRLLLCFMLFCVSAVLCICRFVICRFVCASDKHMVLEHTHGLFIT